MGGLGAHIVGVPHHRNCDVRLLLGPIAYRKKPRQGPQVLISRSIQSADTGLTKRSSHSEWIMVPEAPLFQVPKTSTPNS